MCLFYHSKLSNVSRFSSKQEATFSPKRKFFIIEMEIGELFDVSVFKVHYTITTTVFAFKICLVHTKLCLGDRLHDIV
jgi:hypothetical protein